MKFEINDIVLYCGDFPDFVKEEKILKILDVLPTSQTGGHYLVSTISNKKEWLNQKYVENCYEFDKNYLRKKKLKKLENEIW